MRKHLTLSILFAALVFYCISCVQISDVESETIGVLEREDNRVFDAVVSPKSIVNFSDTFRVSFKLDPMLLDGDTLFISLHDVHPEWINDESIGLYPIFPEVEKRMMDDIYINDLELLRKNAAETPCYFEFYTNNLEMYRTFKLTIMGKKDDVVEVYSTEFQLIEHFGDKFVSYGSTIKSFAAKSDAAVNEGEPNNTVATANSCSLNGNDSRINGNISISDVDYYRLTVPSIGAVELVLIVSGGAPTLEVYDSTGSRLIQKSSPTSSPATLSFGVSRGEVYYIRVMENARVSASPYNISLKHRKG